MSLVGQELSASVKERVEKARARVKAWRGSQGSTSAQLIREVREKGLVETYREHRARRGQLQLGLKHYGKEHAIEAEKIYRKEHAIETQGIRYDAYGKPYQVDERGMYTGSIPSYLVNSSGFGRSGTKYYGKNVAVTLE